MAPRVRPLSLTTPLGRDVLLVAAMTASEAVSAPFVIDLDLAAPDAVRVPFEQLIGQVFTVELVDTADNPGRQFSGICTRFSQGGSSGGLTSYRAELVPWLSLLERRAGSRIFQQRPVPDIVSGLAANSAFGLSLDLVRTYPPRDYCVQYRETDFNFVSRLMEEEGIFYFFRHADGTHQLVAGDAQATFPTLPGGAVRFDASGKKAPRVFEWEKTQELRSGLTTLRDFHFELPHETLEAAAAIQPAVQAGAVTHHLALAGNDKLEIYDYPGGYAKRFDGIGPGGEQRPGDLQQIAPAAQAAAATRMEEEALPSLEIAGSSTCRTFTSGYRFTLQGNGDADGAYVLTGVEHTARITGDVRNPGARDLDYSNAFTAIPDGLPYRPSRKTPRPVVAGTQTAVVVGPAGEEIFTDQFGRVKVQFHWDREGKSDSHSSCWIRVGALHAGSEQGFVAVPRVGQEVIVDFLEGDPDQPIVIGSVYGPDHLPPLGSAG